MADRHMAGTLMVDTLILVTLIVDGLIMNTLIMVTLSADGYGRHTYLRWTHSWWYTLTVVKQKYSGHSLTLIKFSMVLPFSKHTLGTNIFYGC